MGVNRSTSMRAAAVVLIASVLAATSAAAEVGPAATPPATEAPGSDPYPSAARALNLPGRATLNCKIAADGTFQDCKVVSEDPLNWGFGRAAMTAIQGHKGSPGAPGATVEVPVSFRRDPADTATSPLAKTPGFEIKTPVWVLKPTAQDFASTYPKGAVEREVGGLIWIACRVAADGRFSGCVVKGEGPKNLGFGQAALALATRFQMEPHLPDGRSVENGVYQTWIRYTMNGMPKEPIEPKDVRWLQGPPSADQPPPDGSAVGGVGAVRCVVDDDGRLADCKVTEDDPLGHGFAKATLDMASELRMEGLDKSKQPTFHQHFVLRVKFRNTGHVQTGG